MKYNMTAAVIGSGFMGKTHAKVLQNLVKKLIICSNDEVGGKALAQETNASFMADYEKMLDTEKPDFVSICLPTHLHHYGVTEAIKRKINVLCEKPFSSTSEEAWDMADCAGKNNVLLMVAHPLRFCAFYEYLRNAIVSKTYGELLSVNLYRHSSMPGWSVGNWLNDTAKSGGVMRDLHIHETDIATFLFGAPKKVFAMVNDGCCNSIFAYNDKKIVNTSSSWRNVKDMFKPGFDAVFENATLRYKDKTLTLYNNDGATIISDSDGFFDEFGEDMYENEIKYFCKCLEEGTHPHRCSPEESALVATINEAEIQSTFTGEFVEVQQ